MSDISNQLIKNSYDYVLQSDLVTGIVYRIGGAIPVNPIFLSGLTINSGFTYSNGTEQNGYVLTCDASGNAYWGPASAVSVSALTYFVSASTPTGVSLQSGDRWFDTNTGDELVWINDGDSAQWIQICCGSGGGGTDTYVTGLTINGNDIVLTQNRTDAYSSFTISLSGITGGTSGDYLPLSGGTVTGNTTFTSGLTVNYIDFDTTPNAPSPTGGTLFYDSANNALAYKPITNDNDVTIQIGQENVLKIYNDTGIQINNGQAVSITGSTSGASTVQLSIASGGGNPYYQVDGVATHNIPNGEFGFISAFGVVRDIDLSAFSLGEDVFLSQTVPGDFESYNNLSFTGRTVQIGHVNDNSTSGELQLNINNESIFSDLPGQLLDTLNGNNSSTGVFQFTGLTRLNSSQVSIGTVRGFIVDNVSSPTNPQVQYIEYPGISALTITNLSSADITYLYLTSGQTIGQKTSPLTEKERRQNIYLGYAVHPRPGNSINNVISRPDSILSPVSQLRDMFEPIQYINGGIYPSVNTGLTFNTSAAYLYGIGVNYVNDQWTPNTFYVAGKNPASFAYRTQTGGTGTTITNIDPTKYDLNGAITNISGNKATNQRIYINSIGVIRIQYGQHVYNTLSDAIQGLQNESFTTFTTIKDTGILIGILSVLSNCTDLTNTSQAQFFLVSKFGETVGAAGGVGTTNLQQAYNNSSEPEITINSTLDGLSIKNGTGNADNTTSLIQGLNSGGTVTSFIRADGLFSGSSISTPGVTANTNGLTANTISATTYYNLPISGVTDGTGISTSITDGNVTITNTAPDLTVTITGGTNIEISGTYPDFGVNYTGTSQNLIASNSCAITPNNRVYVGNSNYGWGYGLWDLEYPSLSEQYSNVSIPINKTILSGESIDVCGKAYVNDSNGDTCTLHFYLYTHNCDITTITELSRRSDLFDKDGLFCFSYRVPIESNLSECDNFLVLGFRATTNDATVCKITYTINSKHNI